MKFFRKIGMVFKSVIGLAVVYLLLYPIQWDEFGGYWNFQYGE